MILKIRKPADKLMVTEYIGKLPDKSYDITVNLHREKRTCPQNRLYWMWINVISKDTGNDPEDLHLYFGEKWLRKIEVRLKNGDEITKRESTTKLNIIEFKDYLDKIQIFASTEFGIVLPNPEDLYFDQMVDWYSNHF